MHGMEPPIRRTPVYHTLSQVELRFQALDSREKALKHPFKKVSRPTSAQSNKSRGNDENSDKSHDSDSSSINLNDLHTPRSSDFMSVETPRSLPSARTLFEPTRNRFFLRTSDVSRSMEKIDDQISRRFSNLREEIKEAITYRGEHRSPSPVPSTAVDAPLPELFQVRRRTLSAMGNQVHNANSFLSALSRPHSATSNSSSSDNNSSSNNNDNSAAPSPSPSNGKGIELSDLSDDSDSEAQRKSKPSAPTSPRPEGFIAKIKHRNAAEVLASFVKSFGEKEKEANEAAATGAQATLNFFARNSSISPSNSVSPSLFDGRSSFASPPISQPSSAANSPRSGSSLNQPSAFAKQNQPRVKTRQEVLQSLVAKGIMSPSALLQEENSNNNNATRGSPPKNNSGSNVGGNHHPAPVIIVDIPRLSLSRSSSRDDDEASSSSDDEQQHQQQQKDNVSGIRSILVSNSNNNGATSGGNTPRSSARRVRLEGDKATPRSASASQNNTPRIQRREDQGTGRLRKINNSQPSSASNTPRGAAAPPAAAQATVVVPPAAKYRDFYFVHVRIHPTFSVSHFKFDVVVTDKSEPGALSYTIKNCKINESNNCIIFGVDPKTGEEDITFSPADLLPWITKPSDLYGKSLNIQVYGTYPRKTRVVDSNVTFGSNIEDHNYQQQQILSKSRNSSSSLQKRESWRDRVANGAKGGDRYGSKSPVGTPRRFDPPPKPSTAWAEDNGNVEAVALYTSYLAAQEFEEEISLQRRTQQSQDQELETVVFDQEQEPEAALEDSRILQAVSDALSSLEEQQQAQQQQQHLDSPSSAFGAGDDSFAQENSGYESKQSSPSHAAAIAAALQQQRQAFSPLLQVTPAIDSAAPVPRSSLRLDLVGIASPDKKAQAPRSLPRPILSTATSSAASTYRSSMQNEFLSPWNDGDEEDEFDSSRNNYGSGNSSQRSKGGLRSAPVSARIAPHRSAKSSAASSAMSSPRSSSRPASARSMDQVRASIQEQRAKSAARPATLQPNSISLGGR